MTQTQVIELQQQQSIKEQRPLDASLKDENQIVIQEGEILIFLASEALNQNKELGWDWFLSGEKYAPTENFTNISTQHANYLYQK